MLNIVFTRMDIQKLLNTIDSQYIIRESSFINEILWTCAGVNKKIIRQCPNDYAKYAGVGGTILFTALMAAFSGGYAMFFVFNSWLLSIIFGIFWGTLIFNLDRFIINSMKIDDVGNLLTWKKVKMQLPRLIMAIFLGIVISTPLEMKIFSDRIETQLLKDNIEHVNSAKQSSDDYTQLQTLQQTQNKLLRERKILNDELLKAQKDLKEEAEGNALSGQAGHGTIYKDKEKYVVLCLSALSNWDAGNQMQLLQISSRIDALSSSVSHFEDNVSKLQEDGFVARYEAFSNLTASNKTLQIMSWMITILFIVIEIIPTFFKLVMPSCMYTELCKEYNDLIMNAYKTKSVEYQALLKQNSQLDNSIVDKINEEISGINNVISELNLKINAHEEKHKLSDGSMQQLSKQVTGIVEILSLINKK